MLCVQERFWGAISESAIALINFLTPRLRRPLCIERDPQPAQPPSTRAKSPLRGPAAMPLQSRRARARRRKSVGPFPPWSQPCRSSFHPSMAIEMSSARALEGLPSTAEELGTAASPSGCARASSAPASARCGLRVPGLRMAVMWGNSSTLRCSGRRGGDHGRANSHGPAIAPQAHVPSATARLSASRGECRRLKGLDAEQSQSEPVAHRWLR